MMSFAFTSWLLGSFAFQICFVKCRDPHILHLAFHLSLDLSSLSAKRVTISSQYCLLGMALLLSYEKYYNDFAGLVAVLPKIARRLPDIVQRRTDRRK